METTTTAHARKIGDEVVRTKTNRSWIQWFAILDRYDVKRNGHSMAAQYIRETYGLTPWWAQAITSRYERERGIRSRV